MSEPENPPALPWYCSSETLNNATGMTLRDYFAAKALDHCAKRAQVSNIILTRLGEETDSVYNAASAEAYKFADAMLAARAK